MAAEIMRAPWTEELIAYCKERRAKGDTVPDIAKDIGWGKATVYQRLNGKRFTPEARAAYREKYSIWFPSRNADKPADPRPSPDIIRERDARLAAQPRNLTASFFGDPLPGYSALELRS